ncbi:DMT family transporter [Echinicola sp. 20G]|uniref:DMT family transporter n=1 Tax=Echinicola sp. 20G TaxID=2781961 RepID=UPI00191115CF|nr:EamA family transporter [Echinicola sp. 20G]
MQTSNVQLKANFALGMVCIIWGTTYYAIKIGVESMPPFLFLGIRQFIAGLVLVLILAMFRRHRSFLRWKYFKGQAVPGIFLIGLGNGLLGMAEKYVPTGLIGIIYSLVPIIVLMYNITFTKGYHINRFTVLSILFGLAGVVFLFGDNSQQGPTDSSYNFGLILAFICAICWAIGGIISKMTASSSNTLINTAFQLISGGLFLFVLSLFFRERLPTEIDRYALWSLLYLTVVASLLTFNAYVYALKHLPLDTVAIHTYINPLVAIIIGWALLDEPVTIFTVLAGGLILISVVFTNKSKKIKSSFGENRLHARKGVSG